MASLAPPISLARRGLVALALALLLLTLVTSASLADPENCENTNPTTGWTKVDNINGGSGSASGDWGSFSWGGMTLTPTITVGYTLEICLKSGAGAFAPGTEKKQTRTFTSASTAWTILQNISHLSWRVTGTPSGSSSMTITKYIAKVATPATSCTTASDWDDANTAPGIPVTTGATVQWCVVVTNTGSTALTGVVITDQMDSLGVTTLTSTECTTITPIPVSGTVTCKYSGTALSGLHTNTARADSNETAEVSDVAKYTASVTGDTIAPAATANVCATGGVAITLNNTASSASVTFVGTNALNNNAVLFTTPVTNGASVTQLVPVGEDVLYNIVVTPTPAGTPASWTFSGTRDCEGVNSVIITEPEEPVVEEIDPRIRVIKSSDKASYTVGETITYTYVITNTGDVTLTTVSLHDDVLGNLTSLIGDRTLDPGEDVTVTTTQLAVEPGDLTNVAVASGLSEEGRVEDDDTVTVSISEVLGIVIDKPPAPAPEPQAPKPAPKPQVAAEELPRTGTDPVRSALLATGMLALGAILLRKNQLQ